MRTSRTATLGILALVFLVLGCSGNATGGDSTVDYLQRLRELEGTGVALEPGSDAERAAIERVKSLLSDFKAPDFEERIPVVYAPDLYFNDTLKTIRTATELQEYLGETAENLERGTVEFLEVIANEGNYYFRWKMDLVFRRYAKGETHTSIGMSHIRFDEEGRVVLHQDYWDAAGGLFEQLPVVGWMIQRVKKRL